MPSLRLVTAVADDAGVTARTHAQPRLHASSAPLAPTGPKRIAREMLAPAAET